jgi:hypothetical protein
MILDVRKMITGTLLLIFPIILDAQEDTTGPGWIELHGYLKDLQSVSFVNNVDSLSSLNLIHNRLNFKFNISKKLSARLEIRNRLFYGDQIKQVPGFGKIIDQYNGVMNLSKLWVDEETLVIHSVIDRMLLQYSTSNWDIKLGRQRINWGINNVWNPNDIFNAYNFLDFDYEERPGNDAIRIQHYFKNNGALEMAYAPGKNKDEGIGAILYKFNKKKYDYQLLGGVFQTDLVIGGGWAGSIKNAGFKGELSYFHPKENITDTAGVLSFSVMSDLTFKNDWYVNISALFNSGASDATAMIANIYRYRVSAKSLFPYRYSFNIGVMKTINPVSSFNFSVIYSPTNNALILFPVYAWNVAKNFDLDFTGQSFFATENNHYKSQGTSLYLRGRWSF